MSVEQKRRVDVAELKRLVYESDSFKSNVRQLQDYVDAMERKESAGRTLTGDEQLFLFSCRTVLAEVEARRPVSQQGGTPA